MESISLSRVTALNMRIQVEVSGAAESSQLQEDWLWVSKDYKSAYCPEEKTNSIKKENTLNLSGTLTPLDKKILVKLSLKST